MLLFGVVCDTAKVRFFKQITTLTSMLSLKKCCLRYCKSTIFQANHNIINKPIAAAWLFAILQKYDFSSKSQQKQRMSGHYCVVCDTAKVRFFKQITTTLFVRQNKKRLFAILQKYDFSSKSQPNMENKRGGARCLRYCKSTIFQANHNESRIPLTNHSVVCDTAKVRFFKQITTQNSY